MGSAVLALLAIIARAEETVEITMDINAGLQTLVVPTRNASARSLAVAAFAEAHGIDAGMGCDDRGCVEAALTRRADEAVRDARLPPARCRNEPCAPISAALDAHGSNKCVSGLGAVYDALLPRSARRAASAVLEVGVGTLSPEHGASMAEEISRGRLRAPDREARPRPEGVACAAEYCVGASLRAWAELFPNARVVGLDPAADARALNGAPGHDRIEVLTCDSTDGSAVAALEGLAARGGPARFDFVVDDGYHSLDAQRKTLAALWPVLAPGGLYAVEDVGDAWAGELASDRGALVDIVGRDTAYFFVETLRIQSATGSWPSTPKMGALVLRKPEDED